MKKCVPERFSSERANERTFLKQKNITKELCEEVFLCSSSSYLVVVVVVVPSSPCPHDRLFPRMHDFVLRECVRECVQEYVRTMMCACVCVYLSTHLSSSSSSMTF